MAWGTANARTVTLSFWVRSSLTRTYCVNVRNYATDRSYVATYTINSSNTFEYKTITIAGDTTGTWLTNNGVGMFISWDLGSGSNANTTAGSWVAANKENTSAQANWIGTSGATFYITGVQLERNTTATPFEWIPYTTELQLCQRYYWMLAPNQSGNRPIGTWSYLLSNYIEGYLQYPVRMRTVPSLDSPTITNGYDIYRAGRSNLFNAIVFGSATDNAVFLYATSGISGTAGQSGSVYCRNATASYLALSAEL